MQNWKGCSSLAEHEIVSLEDTRDSTIYKVSKLKDGKCWMIDDLKIANKTITSSNSDVSSSFTLPSSSTSGFSDFDVANVYIDPIYGGYYTWYAATAGEGKYNMTKGDSSHSICPKGWRLPTGGTGSEFETLENLYDDNPLATPVPGFKLGGLYFYSKPLYVGDQGGYWSSTASDRYSAYVIQVSSSGLGYKVVGDKPSGGPMRCVARE